VRVRRAEPHAGFHVTGAACGLILARHKMVGMAARDRVLTRALAAVLIVALLGLGLWALRADHGAWELASSPQDAGPAPPAAAGSDPVARPASHPAGPASGPADRALIGVAEPAGTSAVTGTVRDNAGQPVAGVEVSLASPLPAGRGLVFNAAATTSAAGTFAFPRLVPPGTWRVGVRDRVVVTPYGLRVATWQARARLDVVVERVDAGARIDGIVVAGDGLPHAGAWVQAAYARKSPRGGREELMAGRAVAGADGRFVLRCLGEATRLVSLSYASADGRMSGATGRRIAWGSTVRLELGDWREPQGLLELLVVGPDGATPVEAFAVACSGGRGPAGPPGRHEARFHPGGRVRIATWASGQHVLFVRPDSPELVPAGPELFDADADGVAMRVVLRRWSTLPVRVQLRDGAPLPGARVELVRPWGEASVHRMTRSLPLSDPLGVPGEGDLAVQVDEAVTDAAGTARLRAPAPESGLAVRVLGPRSLIHVVEGITVSPGGTSSVVVVVELGGTLHAHVLGSEELQRYRVNPPFPTCAAADIPPARTGPMLALTRSGMPRSREPAPETCWPVGSDGRVLIEGIEPGDWEIHLVCWTTLGSTDSLVCWSSYRPLATVRFDGAEEQSVELDARPHAPARVEGRVVDGGEPVPHAHLQIVLQRWPEAVRAHAWLTGVDGRFTLDPLPPGSLVVLLDTLDPLSGEWSASYLPWLPPLKSGATVRHDFVVPHPRPR
jgi:hypothetical protein